MLLFTKPQLKKPQNLEYLRIYPVLNSAGEERFGAIELSPACADFIMFEQKGRKKYSGKSTVLTGGLRLFGPKLNLWLAEEQTEQDFWHALTEALPEDCAVQFILQKRPSTLQKHYEALQEAVNQRIGDPETAYLFLQDYLENLIYPVEDAGLAEQQALLLISALDEEDLGERLATLFATLPCDSAPLNSRQLEEIVAEYGLPNEPIYYDNHLEASDPRTYWTVIAPPPQAEGGWTRRLLESEDLASSKFDIVAHLTPGKPDNTMRYVLQRRQAALQEMLDSAEIAGVKQTTLELTEQLGEIERRLATLDDQGQPFYEVSLAVSLRCSAEDIEEEADDFELALLAAKLSPRRVVGLSGLELAWKDCAPLNLPQLARLFVVGEQPPAGVGRAGIHSAGRLVQLATAGGFEVSDSFAPLVGYSRTGEAFQLETGLGTTLFLTGDNTLRSTEVAHNLVKYIVAMRYLTGGKFCIFDPKGNWLEVARQVGINSSQIIRPYHLLNLLEADPQKLQRIDQIEAWVNSTSAFLSALLKLDSQEGLEALLLGAVVALQGEGTPISTESLWLRVTNDGNEELANQLSRLVLDGDLAWLFNRPEDATFASQDMLLLGFDAEEISAIPEKARQLILTRLFSRLAPLLADHTLVVDEVTQFLNDPASSQVLIWLTQQNRNLWAITSTCDDLLTSESGRKLFEQATTHLFFRQSGPGLSSVAKRLDISGRAVKTIRELAAGAAVVRRCEGGQVQVSAFEPLPGGYTNRLAVKRPLALPALKAAFPISSPIETPEPDSVRIGA